MHVKMGDHRSMILAVVHVTLVPRSRSLLHSSARPSIKLLLLLHATTGKTAASKLASTTKQLYFGGGEKYR